MNDQRGLGTRDLRAYFFAYEGVAKAVDGISYQLAKGDLCGVVGESGCQTATFSLCLLEPLLKDSRSRTICLARNIFARL